MGSKEFGLTEIVCDICGLRELGWDIYGDCVCAKCDENARQTQRKENNMLNNCECGGGAELEVFRKDTGRYDVEWYFVFCTECGYRTPLCDTENAAIMVWGGHNYELR